MAFDDLLKQLGGVGRFQQIQVTLLFLPLLLLFSHITLQNFTAAIPAHHCRPQANASLGKGGELEAWLPRDRQGQPASCLRFTSPQSGPRFPNGSEANGTAATEPCVDGWIYDNSTFPSTIVTEWDLVCTHRNLPQLSQFIFMTGMLLGNLIFGNLTDRVGRRKVLTWSYLQLAVSGTCTAFTPNFTAYCACRFFSSMAISGIATNSLTFSLEWLPIHTRPALSLLYGLCNSLCQLSLVGMAYAVPDWRHLQLLVSLPFFVIFIYSRSFTESALWYFSSGRQDLSLKALQRVAQINGKQEEGAKLSMELLQMHLQKNLTMNMAQPSMLQLLRSPAVRHLLLCLAPLWSSLNLSHFGLVMSLQSFGINIYLMQVLFTSADILFHFLSFLTNKSLGRRSTQMASLLLSGICILASAMVPQDQLFLHITMAVLGKGCITGSFNCIIMYTGELCPTVMRQRGMALTTTLGIMGGSLSPLVAMTTEFHPSLPLFIYGAAPATASVVTLFLPETQGQPLPNTIQDLERRWKKKLEQEQQMVPLQAS
ncbi:solute carrier family 22 member 6-like [Pteronotus mesoamericanus]|uniref:solute carrier family 22 member 6-like n=1 Tax=Pteronotus mesoamericanus TaxID=1884717 RepID=UPI0023ED4FFC|nr:solute carrier family 22 member 6-like [Pteronotus parnellii mesoamericanus]